MKQRHDRILGTLLGVAIGDALGATYEFTPAHDAQYATGDIVGGGYFHWRPGQPTDDTDQTLIVAKAVAIHRGVDAIVGTTTLGLIDWWQKGPKDVGATTSYALRQRAASHKVNTFRSKANGSLMRTAPIGFLPTSIRNDAARRVSRITHTSPDCVNDCIDYSNLIAYYAAGGEAIIPSPDDPREWYDGGGHVRDSYDIALWALNSAEYVGAADALLEVVRLGGDTDTNAAIAGGLLGARNGTDAWPGRWIDRLETAGEIFDLAEEINKQWEGEQ